MGIDPWLLDILAVMATDPATRGRLEPLRVAVIGLGAVAQAVHLPLLDRLTDRFRVAAIADLSPSLVETIGARYAVPPELRATEAGSLLASDRIDAAVILTSGSHGALADVLADLGSDRVRVATDRSLDGQRVGDLGQLVGRELDLDDRSGYRQDAALTGLPLAHSLLGYGHKPLLSGPAGDICVVTDLVPRRSVPRHLR